MTVERHLILQEMTLRPSGEWMPQPCGWTVARVVEGVGYWLQGGNACALNVGDGFVTDFNAKIILRASQLGPLKLQFFTIQPQYLNGLLTVAEWHQLETISSSSSAYVSVFTAGWGDRRKIFGSTRHPPAPRPALASRVSPVVC